MKRNLRTNKYDINGGCMNYTIRTEHKNGTIEFYYKFNDNAFISHLATKKNLKDKVNALSFAISWKTNTVRVIKPLGTNEQEFNEKMHNFFQMECNLQALSCPDDSFSSIFGSLFGGAL